MSAIAALSAVAAGCGSSAPPAPASPSSPASPEALEAALHAEIGEPDGAYVTYAPPPRDEPSSAGPDDTLRAEIGEPDPGSSPDASDETAAWIPEPSRRGPLGPGAEVERRGPYLVWRADRSRYTETCVTGHQDRSSAICGRRYHYTLAIRDIAWTGEVPARSRDGSRLRNAIQDVRGRLEPCQDARPHVTGAAHVTLVALPSGAVTSLALRGLADAEVSECLRRALAGLRVPARTGPPLVVSFDVVLEDRRAAAPR